MRREPSRYLLLRFLRQHKIPGEPIPPHRLAMVQRRLCKLLAALPPVDALSAIASRLDSSFRLVVCGFSQPKSCHSCKLIFASLQEYLRCGHDLRQKVVAFGKSFLEFLRRHNIRIHLHA